MGYLWQVREAEKEDHRKSVYKNSNFKKLTKGDREHPKASVRETKTWMRRHWLRGEALRLAPVMKCGLGRSSRTRLGWEDGHKSNLYKKSFALFSVISM